ncbi:MAG: DUF1592 domain-containing protein [Alphaproteobacteria bacterium]|nr:DUF1592 domain-containing protein [Alphaproteobacteria bacterium]
MTRRPSACPRLLPALVAACVAGCLGPAAFRVDGDDTGTPVVADTPAPDATGDTAAPVDTGPPPPPLRPAPAGLRTLTPAQYVASVRTVLGAAGDGLEVPSLGAWATSVGAAQGGIPAGTAVAYEGAARAVATAVFDDPDRRAALVDCTPAADPADPCTAAFVAQVGRRAFRRALDEAEQARWVAVAEAVAAEAGAWEALRLVLSGLLQSPSFLYRVELGEPDPTAPPDAPRLRYADTELATRLSYLLWGDAPDEALLDAAEAGLLADPTGLEAQVDRMLADPRAAHGLEAFLRELLQVDGLQIVEKDEALFPDFPQQREALADQLLQTALAAVREQGGFRALFTTRTLFVDDRTAPLYGLPSPGSILPSRVTAPAERAGVLTTAGFLALHAYPGKTSPALRGLFVRKTLLCHAIKPPPAGVVTVLPDRTDQGLVTTRELVAVHQDTPACGACHRYMDPIGLGLEQFDALGRYRQTEHGLPIDPSGELDGIAFADGAALGGLLAQHPALLPCVAAHLVAQAGGFTVDDAHPEVEALAVGQGGAAAMLRAVALSDLFRLAWPADPEVTP